MAALRKPNHVHGLTRSHRVALSALLVALGVALSVYPGPIPFGPAKLYPFQSMINVLAGFHST